MRRYAWRQVATALQHRRTATAHLLETEEGPQMRPLFFCCSFDVIARNAGNAATVHSTDEARTEAAASTRLQAQYLLDVRSNQLGLQMIFSHKVRDVNAVVESLLDAVVQHA